MPHITIEYTILIPLLIAQILIFPLAASMMVSSWSDSRREVMLQDVANHVASTIQQLYLTLNRDEVTPGNITQALTVPQMIESKIYTATGSLSPFPDPNSSRVLTVTITLEKATNTATANAVLGQNSLWVDDSFFVSTSPNPSVRVQKFDNGTLLLSFEGGL